MLKIACDIIFGSFRKCEVGKVTHRKCEVNKRHSKAEQLDPVLLQPGNQLEKEWQVKSSTDCLGLYYVRLEKENFNCKLRCEKCNVCVHMYSCTCLDATLHYAACKHVHLVHMHRHHVQTSVEMMSKGHPVHIQWKSQCHQNSRRTTV